MTQSFNDRCWLLLVGCLAGMLVSFTIGLGSGSAVDPAVAVASVSATFFLAYGAQRFLLVRTKNAGWEEMPHESTNGTTRNVLPCADGTSDSYPGFLHSILDSLETQVCILDVSGRLVETNAAWDRFAKQIGCAKQNRVGASFEEFSLSAHAYQNEGAAQIHRAAASVAADGSTQAMTNSYELLIDGVKKSYRVTVKPLPLRGHGAVAVMQQDLTEASDYEQRIMLEKQRAETLADALETSQNSLALAMKGGEIGMWHWDVATEYFELVSADWLEKLGCENGTLNADVNSFRDLIHEDELVFWTLEDAASLAADEPYDRQFRLRLPDGSYRWVQVLGRSNAMNPDGSPESLSGILIDIDARKTAELRHAGMARIIEDSINEIYVIDRKSLRFVEVNRGGRENIGYSDEEISRMTPIDIKPEYNEETFAELVRPLNDGSVRNIEFETVHQRKDGSSYPIMISLQINRLLDRDVYVAIGSDLTQHHQLESQLAEAKRLESIGQLAAGVAHEMNTPLQFVGNNISFLSDCSDALFDVIDRCQEHLETDQDDPSYQKQRHTVLEAIERKGFHRIRTEAPKAISESLEGIDRVLKIVRAMKEFTHPGDETKTPADLNRALKTTATVTENRWKEIAELELDLDANLPHVMCHGGPLNQVFVNLIVNAADAIADEAASKAGSPAGKIWVRTRKIGDMVQIEVEDNGSGMPEEVQQRIFDPFFTTKEVGKGTGQGLTLCHTIVTQKHDGSLTVHSKAGEGTIMRIMLPINEVSVAQASDKIKQLALPV